MSVRREKHRDADGVVREYWMVEVNYKFPDGHTERIRRRSPVQTRKGAEEHERQIRNALQDGTFEKEEKPDEKPEPTIPSVSVFADEFLRTYVDVNNKPSERKTKRIILDQHIRPRLGRLQLDEVGAHIEPFKADLLAQKLSRKRVNNILAVLSKMLRYAEERSVIDRAPKVRLLKVAPTAHDYFTFEEYDALVAAAESEADWHVAILLAGDAGLRAGEIIALERKDVNFNAGNLSIRRSSWEGIIGSPKGGRARVVPMTSRLRTALLKARHLKGPIVLCHGDGKPWTADQMKRPLWRICKRVGLRLVGWHVLRHTFCSHLAMRGAAPTAIQELAGHESFETTKRYLHLAPVMLRETVKLLERREVRCETREAAE